MTTNDEAILEVLERARVAREALDAVATACTQLERSFARHQAIQAIGASLTDLFRAQSFILDLAPHLVPSELRPSAEPIDLRALLEQLDGDEIHRRMVLMAIQKLLPNETLARYRSLGGQDARVHFVKEWAAKQPERVRPLGHLYRLLREEWRWRRFHAAKALEEVTGVEFWDDDEGDVRLHVADVWYREGCQTLPDRV